MKELVTYKSPGIETESPEEGPSKLSKLHIVFMVAFPLLFLLSVIITRAITGILGPIVSSNLLYSTVVGFSAGILVFIILTPKLFRIPK